MSLFEHIFCALRSLIEHFLWLGGDGTRGAGLFFVLLSCATPGKIPVRACNAKNVV